MSLNKIKPEIIEIEETRCILVEKDVTLERMEFLKNLLSHNGYTVLVQKDESTYTLGVKDLLFNPVLDVYKRKLKRTDGKKITPAYWLQLTDNATEKEINYWTK